jgi:hypothetical protein
MRSSTRHIAGKIGLVAAFVVLVGGAWVAQSGGFAVAVAIVLIAFIAALVPIAVIVQEEHDLPSDTRHGHV